MRILITGGAGYVGSACLRFVASMGHEVVAYDNLAMGHAAATDGHPLIEADIADTARLADALTRFGADAVMHFAAASNVGESVENPEYHYRNNICGTLSLLSAMREAGVRRLLFSSSCAIYGDAEGTTAMSEDLPKLPVSPYARTKLAVEWMIADFARVHGLGYTLLRYFNAAGGEPDGRHGEDHTPENHLIPLILQTALGQRDRISIFGTDYPTPDGTCVRDYVHVRDLASAHLLALGATEPGSAEVYNVGTGRGQSVREIIEACEAVVGREIPKAAAPRRPGDAACLVADASKLMSRLGWHPEYTSVGDTIATAWAWHQAHPRGYKT